MNLLVLGRGKTGSLVAEVAREHGHNVRVAGKSDNQNGAALTRERLADVDVVVDFTTPADVLENTAACAAAGRSMVVGTTGWYDSLPRVRDLVAKGGIGFLYSANFSVGVNLFFDIARTAAATLRQGYRGNIVERHHVHKKDAPSGTAVKLREIIEDASGAHLEVASVREGEVVGTHIIQLDSPSDTITLTHEARSRRGFAEGAVRAAEWMKGKKGFFEFKDVLKD
ncbi:MAG: 4-hydroxy-tetrahydrodipicolinate reductase [Terriglobales bacterium]